MGYIKQHENMQRCLLRVNKNYSCEKKKYSLFVLNIFSSEQCFKLHCSSLKIILVRQVNETV